MCVSMNCNLYFRLHSKAAHLVGLSCYAASSNSYHHVFTHHLISFAHFFNVIVATGAEH